MLMKPGIQSLSHVRLCVTLWTVARQASLAWNSPGKNTGVGYHSLLQGSLPDPGIKPGSPTLQTDSLPSEEHISPHK